MKKTWGALAVAMLLQGVHAAELRATVRDEQGRPLRDAVVIAVAEVPPVRPRSRVEQVEQIDLEFVPGVKAILVGTPVSFPNRDDVRHHVYSFSQAKRFELPLYVGTPAQPILFDTPGVVTIGCNIHDWMIGYIYVSESPFFAVSSADGSAVLTGLPAGRYTVRAWHARMRLPEETTRRPVDFTGSSMAYLEWQVALKPELRVRRAPAPGQGGRY